MCLKTHRRKKNGKVNEYYSIVEKRKVSQGRYVQKRVLYLGKRRSFISLAIGTG
jgi:hypothetical protein